jgi:DNA polymerase elongation subunit (family B)
VRDGKRIEAKVPYSPTLYAESNKSVEFRGLYGEKLVPVKFESIHAAKEYIGRYEEVKDFTIHGIQQFQYQYISDKFVGDIDWDIDQARVVFLDIETKVPENGFPNIETANCEILLISLMNRFTQKIVVFGTRSISAPNPLFEYRLFKNEASMLEAFLDFWSSAYPDVISGWNIDGFDMPYIANRIHRVLGEAEMKRLSPWGVLNSRKIEVRGREVEVVDIVGINSLDYLDLYKKFSFRPQESYSLGAVCQVDLGEGKVDFGCTFKESYSTTQENWDRFVLYNAMDSQLVFKLDKMYEFIPLCFSIAYLAKCNIKDVFSPVKTWDIFTYSELLKENIIVPPHTIKKAGTIEGAYVKAPQLGMHNWVVTVDFGSLYPSEMRQWNISPETILKEKFDLHYIDFIEETDAYKDAIEYARAHDYSLAANGSMYRRDIVGIIPKMLKMCMDGRKVAKKEMLRLEQLLVDTGDSLLKSKISVLNGRQLALKLLGNSLYGGLANVGSRYFNLDMAESITITGQLSNVHVSKCLNEYMNSNIGGEYKDYIIYGDTDSSFLNCGPLIKKIAAGKSDQQITNLLMKMEPTLQRVLNKSIDDVFALCNCLDRVMSIKQEKVCSKILFVAKKRYAAKVHNSEGVMYDPPEIKVTGLDLVKTSTPMAIRKMLKASIPVIFDGGEGATQKYLVDCREKFDSMTTEEIARPTGVSEVDKHMIGEYYVKGCPINSRASIIYNVATKSMREKYAQISNGDKIRYLYLTVPNPVRSDVIAFPADGVLPKELGLHNYVDRDTQFYKTFMKPIEGMLHPIGWKTEVQASLEDFFG